MKRESVEEFLARGGKINRLTETPEALDKKRAEEKEKRKAVKRIHYSTTVKPPEE